MEEFRSVFGRRNKEFYSDGARVLCFSSGDVKRKMRRLYEESESVRALWEILEAMPKIKDQLHSGDGLEGINVGDEGTPHLPVNLIPQLEAICRRLFNQPVDINFRMGTHGWDRNDALQSRWHHATEVAMMHINGGIFRYQRLKWQIKKFQRKIPEGFIWPHKPTPKASMSLEDSVKFEVQGPEPWGRNLKRLSVFVASPDMYIRWKRASSIRDFPNPASTGAFWGRYMKKLRGISDKEYHDGKRESGMELSVGRVNYMDFLGYFIDWKKAGGFIVGTPMLCGCPAPRVFEVEWPVSARVPEHFESVRSVVRRVTASCGKNITHY